MLEKQYFIPEPEEFKLHIHPQAELLYIISGGGSFHIEGNVYDTKRCSIILTRPTESHYLEVDCTQFQYGFIPIYGS